MKIKKATAPGKAQRAKSRVTGGGGATAGDSRGGQFKALREEEWSDSEPQVQDHDGDGRGSTSGAFWSTAEATKAAGMGLALGLIERYTDKRHRPAYWALRRIGILLPSEDALQQVAQVNQTGVRRQLGREVEPRTALGQYIDSTVHCTSHVSPNDETTLTSSSQSSTVNSPPAATTQNPSRQNDVHLNNTGVNAADIEQLANWSGGDTPEHITRYTIECETTGPGHKHGFSLSFYRRHPHDHERVPTESLDELPRPL